MVISHVTGSAQASWTPRRIESRLGPKSPRLCNPPRRVPVISGTFTVEAQDGMEIQIGPGDAYVIEPGHDAWVFGNEPYVASDFSEQMEEYAKPR